MRTSVHPTAPRCIAALTLALAFGLSGAAQAFAADAASAASTPMQSGTPGIASHDANARADWNVDYPSQLGPEGPASADAGLAGPQAMKARPQSHPSPAQPPAGR